MLITLSSLGSEMITALLTSVVPSLSVVLRGVRIGELHLFLQKTSHNVLTNVPRLSLQVRPRSKHREPANEISCLTPVSQLSAR